MVGRWQAGNCDNKERMHLGSSAAAVVWVTALWIAKALTTGVYRQPRSHLKGANTSSLLSAQFPNGTCELHLAMTFICILQQTTYCVIKRASMLAPGRTALMRHL